jgi:hypothetical protein
MMMMIRANMRLGQGLDLDAGYSAQVEDGGIEDDNPNKPSKKDKGLQTKRQRTQRG